MKHSNAELEKLTSSGTVSIRGIDELSATLTKKRLVTIFNPPRVKALLTVTTDEGTESVFMKSGVGRHFENCQIEVEFMTMIPLYMDIVRRGRFVPKQIVIKFVS